MTSSGSGTRVIPFGPWEHDLPPHDRELIAREVLHFYVFCHSPIDQDVIKQMKPYGAPKLSRAWSKLDSYEEYLGYQRWIRDYFDLVPLDVEHFAWLKRDLNSHFKPALRRHPGAGPAVPVGVEAVCRADHRPWAEGLGRRWHPPDCERIAGTLGAGPAHSEQESAVWSDVGQG